MNISHKAASDHKLAKQLDISLTKNIKFWKKMQSDIDSSICDCHIHLSIANQ